MTAPIAVVVGFIGKLPVAGMSLYNIHYIRGLIGLGYEVHYAERLCAPGEAYDPIANAATDDHAYGLRYVQELLPRYGVPPERISFIDRESRCHGAGWGSLERALRLADFVITLADATWFDQLSLCPRRAFVDGDPLFTQAALLTDGPVRKALPNYDVWFTIGVRIGEEDCAIPVGEHKWIPARSVVATDLWQVLPIPEGAPATTVMNWAAWSDVVVDGRTYGHKNRELERLIDLPRRTEHRLALAVGGKEVPRDRLRSHGWQLVDPLEATLAVEDYRAFIAGSLADLGIAKHAYVASRSGWFSDRSLCYLASGRPVLHQDTGLADWLPTGEGLLLFDDADDIVRGLTAIARDPERHSRAARRIAEEHFEAVPVVKRLLEDAGYR